MPQHIQAPDGSVVEFPDGMNDAQMSAVMAKNYPTPQAPPEKPRGPRFGEVVGGAWDRLKTDAATAYGPQTPDELAQKPVGVSRLTPKPGPASPRLAAADRLGSDLMDLPTSLLRGAMTHTTGMSENDANALLMTGSMLLGPKGSIDLRKPAARAPLPSSPLPRTSTKLAPTPPPQSIPASINPTAPLPMPKVGVKITMGDRALGAAGEIKARAAQALGQEPAQPSAAALERAGPRALDVVRNLARDTPADSLLNNPLERAGKPITAAEAIGRPAVTQLGAIARRSGTTADTLESSMRMRGQSIPDRVLSDLHEITGVSPEATAGDMASLAKSQREIAAPLYDKAYAAPPPQSPTLARLAETPPVKKAMRDADRLIALDAAGKGIDPATIVKGSPQHWDYVKRALDDQVQGMKDPITGRFLKPQQGIAYEGVTRALRNELVQINPAYGEALQAGGEPIRLEQAFKGAKTAFGPNTSDRMFADKFSKLSPAEQEAQRAGILNWTYEQAQNGRLRLKDLQTPAFRAKFNTAFGPERAGPVMSRLEMETMLAETGQRMRPGVGSPTMEFGAAEADRTAEMLSGVKTASTVAGKFGRGDYLGGALHAVAAPVEAAWAGAQAPLDTAVRNEVGRLLQLSPSELAKLLQESRPGAKALGPKP